MQRSRKARHPRHRDGDGQVRLGRSRRATVTLTNESTGGSFTTVTNATGTYAFESVQVGTYSIAVELGGFEIFASCGLSLVWS